jgi:hypothetical protein
MGALLLKRYFDDYGSSSQGFESASKQAADQRL